MSVLKADHDRAVELAGAGMVPRPVDIDQTQTGFKTLRTLRIYRFSPPQVIDGHAEEDEVYIVVLSGSVKLVVRSKLWDTNTTSFALTAASDHRPATCAAYLPPHAEYVLTPMAASDIAYARARPSTSRRPAVLTSTPQLEESGVWVLLDDSQHAERLRIRMLHVSAGSRAAVLTPIREADPTGEALIHLRCTPVRGAAELETPGASAEMLESWDTIAVAPGERPTLRIAAEASATGFVVAAL